MSKPKVEIIAEAGVNHNGDLSIALELIDAAANAGADYIKFQTFKAANLATKKAEKALYQKKSDISNETQYEMLSRLELSFEAHQVLLERCQEKKIGFLSSAFDFDSLDLLSRIDLPMIKIPSGEITNLPYLKYVGKMKKKIILSTGMANIDEIQEAISVLTQRGTEQKNIIILQCNSEYPTPMEDVNLLAMTSMAQKFNTKVGYSDHTLGIEVPIAAVALGAVVIEKHFTLDRNFEGPDHHASLEPEELIRMVQSIRNIEKALGDSIKKPSTSEKLNIPIVRKSIVTACPIKQGERFSEQNLCVKRPGTGVSPMRWDEVMGLFANKDYNKDELISL